MPALFMQDSFRANARLTVNYGVRWSPALPWHDKYHEAESFSPANYASGTGSIVYPNAPAGMIDHINSNKEVHVVTIEDPIEVLHFDKMAMINQREVRVDTEDFVTAMRAAMRQDPDVILVGEMRDHETVKAALAAAETGHFVLSTLHTTDAQETVNRVIDFFPPHEQKQVRLSLAGALRGIVCQRLVPRADGEGRCVAMEVAVNTGRIAEAIAEPDKTSTMTTLIADGSFYGMQTFDQHLVALFRDGVITLEAAMGASTSPHDLMVELRRLGLVA
jgi:twitching motility protein PilT